MCLLSGGLANVGSVKGLEGLVNIERIVRRMDRSIRLTHPDKVIARVQTSEGPRRELSPLYNRLW